MIVLDKDNIQRTTRDSRGRFAKCDARWIQYDIEPFTQDCKCDFPECDPNSCPRFTDTCCVCGRLFTGSGWQCLSDGDGDTACDDCVKFRTDSHGNRY